MKYLNSGTEPSICLIDLLPRGYTLLEIHTTSHPNDFPISTVSIRRVRLAMDRVIEDIQKLYLKRRGGKETAQPHYT